MMESSPVEHGQERFQQKGGETNTTADDSATQPFLARSLVRAGQDLEEGSAVTASSSSKDPSFRRRLLWVSCLFCAFIMLGWTDGLKGPLFPDLQLILGVDLETASWLFTANSGGNLVGAIAQFYFLYRFRNVTLVTVSLVGLAVSCAALPWCSLFPLMLAMMAVMGMSAVVLGSSGNAEVVSLWGRRSSSFIHALNLCHSLGTIVSPLAAEPFMAKRVCVPVDKNRNDADTKLHWNQTTSFMDDFSLKRPVVNMSVVANGTTIDCEQEFMSTHVNYIYIITAILTMISALPFIVMAIHSVCKTTSQDDTNDVGKPEQTERHSNNFSQLFRTLQNTFFLLLCTYGAVAVCIELSYYGFLMTFVLNHLAWGKRSGAAVTSLSWGTFACGRFIAIFLGHCLQSSTILFSFGALRICGFALFWASASLSADDSLFWLSFALIGFSNSVMLPAMFAWCNERLTKMTSRISAMLFISFSASSMVMLYIFGFLMEIKSPVWFIYLLTAMSAFALFLLFILVVMANKFLQEKGESITKS